jgi:hypothetical protein
VAHSARTAKRCKACEVTKYACFHCAQKYTITENMVPVCSMTSTRVISGEDGFSPSSFSATTTCAELETGKSSARP